MNIDRVPVEPHGPPVLPPSEHFRLEYLAWYVVTSGETAGDARAARNGRARMIKFRVPGAPLPDTGWAIVPVGNCLACSYHDPGVPSALPEPPDQPGSLRTCAGRVGLPGV